MKLRKPKYVCILCGSTDLEKCRGGLTGKPLPIRHDQERFQISYAEWLESDMKPQLRIPKQK